MEEFASDFCDGGHASSVNVDQDSHFGDLLLVSQCETPSADDLERNVSPFADEMSPKTYQEMVKSIREDPYQPPLAGPNQVSSPMDANPTFSEYLSHGSQHVTTPTGYVSTESQAEQLQLTTSMNSIINPAPSPSVVQSPMTPGTPGSSGIQYGDVEQILSVDGSEVNVVFNSHKSASACRNWYGALFHVVPEVIKPQQNTKKEHLQIKIPSNGM